MVITEEPDSDDEDEIEESPVLEDEDEDYNEDAEFAGLDEKIAAANALATAAKVPPEAAAATVAIKQEIKQEVFDDDVEELEEEEEEIDDPLSNLIKNHLNISTASNPTTSNKSSEEVASQQNQAWQNLVAKQELSACGAATSPTSAAAVIGSGRLKKVVFIIYAFSKAYFCSLTWPDMTHPARFSSSPALP